MCSLPPRYYLTTTSLPPQCYCLSHDAGYRLFTSVTCSCNGCGEQVKRQALLKNKSSLSSQDEYDRTDETGTFSGEQLLLKQISNGSCLDSLPCTYCTVKNNSFLTIVIHMSKAQYYHAQCKLFTSLSIRFQRFLWSQLHTPIVSHTS